MLNGPFVITDVIIRATYISSVALVFYGAGQILLDASQFVPSTLEMLHGSLSRTTVISISQAPRLCTIHWRCVVSSSFLPGRVVLPNGNSDEAEEKSKITKVTTFNLARPVSAHIGCVQLRGNNRSVWSDFCWIHRLRFFSGSPFHSQLGAKQKLLSRRDANKSRSFVFSLDGLCSHLVGWGAPTFDRMGTFVGRMRGPLLSIRFFLATAFLAVNKSALRDVLKRYRLQFVRNMTRQTEENLPWHTRTQE